MALYTCSATRYHHQILTTLFSEQRCWSVEGDYCTTSHVLLVYTYVSIRGQLLVIGGWRDTDGKPITAIHMYNPTTDSWEVISHMGTPRRGCIATVLPNNQLMVVGGKIGKKEFGTNTVSTELTAIELLLCIHGVHKTPIHVSG